MHMFELWLSVFTANLLLENATPENFITDSSYTD